MLQYPHFLHVVREDGRRSLDQLAQSVGSTRHYLAHLDRGEAPHDPSILQRLAETLDVDVRVLTADRITIHRDGRIEIAR